MKKSIVLLLLALMILLSLSPVKASPMGEAIVQAQREIYNSKIDVDTHIKAREFLLANNEVSEFLEKGAVGSWGKALDSVEGFSQKALSWLGPIDKILPAGSDYKTRRYERFITNGLFGGAELLGENAAEGIQALASGALKSRAAMIDGGNYFQEEQRFYEKLLERGFTPYTGEKRSFLADPESWSNDDAMLVMQTLVETAAENYDWVKDGVPPEFQESAASKKARADAERRQREYEKSQEAIRKHDQKVYGSDQRWADKAYKRYDFSGDTLAGAFGEQKNLKDFARLLISIVMGCLGLWIVVILARAFFNADDRGATRTAIKQLATAVLVIVLLANVKVLIDLWNVDTTMPYARVGQGVVKNASQDSLGNIGQGYHPSGRSRSGLGDGSGDTFRPGLSDYANMTGG